MGSHQEKEQVAVNQPTWHSKEAEEVLKAFSVDENGLSFDEVNERKKQYGENIFSKVEKKSIFRKLLDQLSSPLVFILVIAFSVTFALQEFVDSGVIAFALLIAVAVGFIQEGKASNAFEKLSKSQEHIAFVVRDGKKIQVSSEELVPGDIVELQSGMQVPADMRLFSVKKLSINEAPLTGEWMSVDKQVFPVEVGEAFAEQSSMAWKGTFVAKGRGMGVVVAIGDKTAVGVLAAQVQVVEDEMTPLQHEMSKVSKVMLYIILSLVAMIFAIGMFTGQSLEEMLLMSIAIAVASVPEGLPAAVTIILAVGMEALLKRGGLVRNLLAAETLGSTTYILTDKTGTLTKGKMAITGVLLDFVLDNDIEHWLHNKYVADLFNIALCGSDSFFDEAANVVRGDPVEAAIYKTAVSVGISPTENSYRANRIDILSFSSELRFAAGLTEINGTRILCINGAPERLIEYATHYQSKDGLVEFTPETKKACNDAIARETSMGKRLVAVAHKQVAFSEIEDEDLSLLENIVFAGVLVFTDPVRSGVAQAIEGVKSAGAEVLLITGDNPQTAQNIAEQVGIAKIGARPVTGSELTNMSDSDIETLLEQNVRVFARVLPQQKLRIAQILQKRGEIVAMTGDGINDAPALRKANIGIAIGSGTEVAKESSDLVLVNDSFATIYAAIEEGRRITSNLRKIVGYLLSTSLSEVVLISAALITGAAAPITAVQILWANVIEEGFMSVAFAFEKGDKDAMKMKPQDIHAEGILSRQMIWFMTFVVTVLSVLILTLYFYLRFLQVPTEELRSAMFLAISIDSLFIAFSYRSLTTPFWKIPIKNNLFFVGSFILSSIMLGLAITIPFMQKFLSYTPLPVNDILLILSFSVASLLMIEIGKWVFFERQERA